MIDQRVSEGLKCNLFNRKALTTTIPAQFIKKFGASVVPIYIERSNDNNFKLKIFAVGVQSSEAVDEITNAIKEANLYDVDAIAIVRGGGSKMDLHIFNSYSICSAVAGSKIPIVTGIGHEYAAPSIITTSVLFPT